MSSHHMGEKLLLISYLSLLWHSFMPFPSVPLMVIRVREETSACPSSSPCEEAVVFYEVFPQSFVLQDEQVTLISLKAFHILHFSALDSF